MNNNRGVSFALRLVWAIQEASKGLTTEGAQTSSHFLFLGIKNQDRLIGLELSFQLNDSDEEQGGSFVAKRFARPASICKLP